MTWRHMKIAGYSHTTSMENGLCETCGKTWLGFVSVSYWWIIFWGVSMALGSLAWVRKCPKLMSNNAKGGQLCSSTDVPFDRIFDNHLLGLGVRGQRTCLWIFRSIVNFLSSRVYLIITHVRNFYFFYLTSTTDKIRIVSLTRQSPQ